MPTILRWKGFRFHFYSNERNEPPHIHVRRGEDTCKFWLDPIDLAYNDGMRKHELTRLRKVVEEHRGDFLRNWHEHIRE
jgi:hypothetical protein